jgi:hypothetical protein
MKIYTLLHFFLLSFILISCKSKEKPCSYGKPVSIFSKNTPKGTNHQFKADKESSNESIRFDSLFQIEQETDTLYIPIQLEILQRGCDQITQEFRFEFFDEKEPMPLMDAPDLAGLLVPVLAEISLIEPKASLLEGIGSTLLKHQNKLEKNQDIAVDQGFTFHLSQIKGNSSTILVLILKK